jgi:TolB-like protein/class 3 adenylate cyclase
MEAVEPKASRPAQPTKLAAIMFADMVAYSKHIEQDEAANASNAARSIELFKGLIGDYGGHVANVAGDGILALFDSADRALRFAIQIQTEFRDQSVWDDGDPIQFRIGLNLGEVMVHEANLHGHCINVAARVLALAEPDSILVTGAIRAAVRGLPGMSLRSLGPQHLKNISEPIEVFAVEQSAAEATRILAAARGPPPPEPVRNPAIAVLALANLSGDPRNDHICEGIAEDIIANLTRFRNLMVIARHSAFLFNLKAHQAQEVQRRLGVRYILGGSLRRADKRLRIAVELIDAETEGALWSDRFSVEVEELFDLQDEIAGAVAARLSVQIDFAERRQESAYPRDMRAYGLLVRGQGLILRFKQDANWHARRLFEEAIVFAPEYSRAHSAISRTHNLDWRYSWSAAPEESLETAIAFARRAKQLDPLDARGFAELAYAKLYSKQLGEALVEYAQAIALNPNDSDIIAEYADALVYADQAQKSVELLEKAMRLNPFYPDWYLWYLADAYDALERYEDVISTVQRMHDPSEGQRLLAVGYAHLGMMNEAQAAAREVMRLHPDFTISRWRQRPAFRDKRVLDRYVEGLSKAGLPD